MDYPYGRGSDDPGLPMNKPSGPSRAEKIETALRAILAEPYGCPMCDSGKLRNAAKKHWPNCGYALANAALT